MRTTLPLLLLVLALGGCSKNPEIDLADGQVFKHPLAASQAECQPTRWDCFEEIMFGANNRVDVVFTDVVDVGKYYKKGNKIIIDIEHPMVNPAHMEFKIINANTLQYNGSNFKRWKGPGGWDFY